MEDLIYLLLIGALIAVVVMAVAVGFAVAATVATICVVGAATYAFLVTMSRGIIHRGGSNAARGPGEPAFRAYYRGQVWRDLKLSANAAWLGATDETERIRNLVPTSWDSNVQTVVRVALTVYAYVGLAIGAFVAAVLGIVPALLIALVAGGAWVLGAPLRGLERIRRRRTGAYFDCQECHDRFPLPQYVCPSCQARHAQLAPGPFGVLKHRCTCGASLPAVQFRGRERLPSECPQGHALGEGVGTVRTFHVPVGGGPSTGKSTYLAAALFELEKAATSGTLATTVQGASRQAYDRALDSFKKGQIPPKTSGLPPAMVAEIRGKQKSALLYAYDVAGEIYATEDELRRELAHGLAEGVVLLIDPFALDRVRTELEDELAAAPELHPSAESPQRMLERFIGVLGEQGADLSKVRAAVCVTKIDGLGIGEAIDRSHGDGEHERTYAWLEREGAGNFLRAAEEAFQEVRCFRVSALGRMPGTGDGPFQPRGALAPMLWLLERAGIEPAAPGEATETTTERLAAAATIDVTPRRPLFTGALDAIPSHGLAANFGIGLLAALALAGPLAGLGSLSSSKPSGTDSALASFEESDGSFEPESESESTESDPTTPTDAEEPPDEPESTSSPSINPNTATRAIRRHFQRISKGNYDGAYNMLSSAYAASNPRARWVAQPQAAQPYVNVTEIGPAEFAGNGVAFVQITFYGHDRYETAASDTKCRRFKGKLRAVKENGAWRYDPTANGELFRTGAMTKTELPSDLDVCNP